MARARNIKPALFKNEILGVADPLYTLMFEGLWLLADRAGRLEDRPLRIKAEVFPYREGLDVGQILSWLHTNGFITRYEVNGVRYIEIKNFEKHQNPHKNEPESEIPSPSAGCTASEEIYSGSEKIGSARADSLNLIPDSPNLIPDTSPSPAKPTSQDDLFAKFWKLYPRKVCKANAEKSWKKLKITTDLFTTIMDSLGKQVVSPDWLKEDGKFVPHATTWLNGRRWEDEVASHPNVHAFPASRHHGFQQIDYERGMTARGDGSYDF